MQADRTRPPRLSTTSPWGAPAGVLDRLGGAWSLQRVVTGQNASQGSVPLGSVLLGSVPLGSVPLGSMRGTATFRRLERGWMAYREEGRLTLPGEETFDAFRDYLYERAPEGFAVFFPETPPRLFHEIRLYKDATGALLGAADHLCGRDHYATRYAFRPDGSFVVQHDVRGPRKDYAITTVYARTG